jgi:hypothetical protein
VVLERFERSLSLQIKGWDLEYLKVGELKPVEPEAMLVKSRCKPPTPDRPQTYV